MKTNPLFISGTSRGGTNLAIMMLSVNSDVSLSQDPFLALYKSFYNAVLKLNGIKIKDLNSPLDEYYYFKEKIKLMNFVQNSDLHVPFNKSFAWYIKHVSL